MSSQETLRNLDVVLLDFQTTGSSPRRGHLLEVAWHRTRAARPLQRSGIVTRLVELPRGEGVPRRISKLTGIHRRNLRGAIPAASIHAELLGLARFPLIIHFARFEVPFLKALHDQHAHGKAFPFQSICTHEIARRLFPGLPRRTLRALAGYFGHDTPALKRAADHVAATAILWRELVSILDRECAVTTLGQLASWLDEPPPRRGGRRIYPMIRERRLALPDVPGIYHLLGRNRQVLYVGKATSLKHRVNSYFQKHRGHNERSLELLTRVKDVRITRTASALEAALLETDEIKLHAPPYNVSLNQPDARVWFFSPDLSSHRLRPDRRHRVGPVPEASALLSLRHLLADDPSRCNPGAILGVPRGLAPAPACFATGLRIFLDRHRLAPGCNHLPALLRLGGRLFRQEPEAGEGGEPPDERRRSWDPATVSGALEGVVRHAAHMIRRARWLGWLCEASLAWRPRNGVRHRLLVFHRGHPGTAEEIPPNASIPIPTGAQRALRDRQRDIEAATYDRLRVLTTELRRLVAERRWIRLRFSASIQLDRAALRKVLRWV